MTTMTSVRGLVTGGVDTHRDVHVAAALDGVGGLLGTASFSTTTTGYRQLLGWLRGFGDAVSGITLQPIAMPGAIPPATSPATPPVTSRAAAAASPDTPAP